MPACGRAKSAPDFHVKRIRPRPAVSSPNGQACRAGRGHRSAPCAGGHSSAAFSLGNWNSGRAPCHPRPARTLPQITGPTIIGPELHNTVSETAMRPVYAESGPCPAGPRPKGPSYRALVPKPGYAPRYSHLKSRLEYCSKPLPRYHPCHSTRKYSIRSRKDPGHRLWQEPKHSRM